MALESPNLDDRNFEQLLADAKRRVTQSCPGWELNPNDAGVVLLEAFAYITDVMLYRLNRVPVKAYIEFLRLMGIYLYPPSAARAELQFSVKAPGKDAVEIPAFTRVAAGRANNNEPPPTFITMAAARVDPGATDVVVPAFHLDFVQAELAGVGSGEPGQSVKLKNTPVVAALPGCDALTVGVETGKTTLDQRVDAREHGGKVFRIWREVESFSQVRDDRHVYTVDRVTGVISFAPALRSKTSDGGLAQTAQALAEMPRPGTQIRVWYGHGGGSAGNVARNTLTTLKDPIAGVNVTNPQPAAGGAAAESVENALVRGPQEMHSLERAVTARDFEMLAVRVGGAARAKAFAQRELWAHAAPGTVEVLLAPNYLEPSMRGSGAVTEARLKEQETPQVLQQIQKKLEQVIPVCTRCKVAWAPRKTARVKADIVVYRGEDTEAVKARVLKNLHEAINPLPTASFPSGWDFGEPLRASRVYDIILKEPGVRYVDKVRLLVDGAPERDVYSLVTDAHQANTWYAAAGNTVYRSMNNGESWERTGTFEDSLRRLRAHPERPGIVVAVTRRADASSSRVYVSDDCAETWGRQIADLAFKIEDVAWVPRKDKAVLLLATDKGLYELSAEAGDGTPLQVLVDAADHDLGFYSVVASRDVRGNLNVAVSAQDNRGVYLSVDGGKPGSFAAIGLANEDVRVLAVQKSGPRAFLWAGFAVPGVEAGNGCHRWELTGSTASAEGWRAFDKEWIGGSCYSIVFDDNKVFASTHHSGVVSLDSGKADAAWEAPQLGCGLPVRNVSLRETKQIFSQVNAAARIHGTLLAGGAEGIFRSDDGGHSYRCVSGTEFTERVAIPETWLFCSGNHEVEVFKENETRGN